MVYFALISAWLHEARELRLLRECCSDLGRIFAILGSFVVCGHFVGVERSSTTIWRGLRFTA
jgi:hypothetical protein